MANQSLVGRVDLEPVSEDRRPQTAPGDSHPGRGTTASASGHRTGAWAVWPRLRLRLHGRRGDHLLHIRCVGSPARRLLRAT